jgi:hypothetical protein
MRVLGTLRYTLGITLISGKQRHPATPFALEMPENVFTALTLTNALSAEQYQKHKLLLFF